MLSPKDPDVDTWFDLDWRPRLVKVWQPDTLYAADEIVRPPAVDGAYFQAEADGLSGRKPPHFGPAGMRVADGKAGLTWLGVDPVDLVLPPISESTWTVPLGITKLAELIEGYLTRIQLSGGTVEVLYDITNRIVSDGRAHEQTFTVSVAQQ